MISLCCHVAWLNAEHESVLDGMELRVEISYKFENLLGISVK